MDRKRLRSVIDRHFDQAELQMLCTDLGIDYENLAGPAANKIQSIDALISFCERHSRRYDLMQALYQLRPFLAWQDEMNRALLLDNGVTPGGFDPDQTQEIPVAQLPSSLGTGPLGERFIDAVVTRLDRLDGKIDRVMGRVNWNTAFVALTMFAFVLFIVVLIVLNV